MAIDEIDDTQEGEKETPPMGSMPPKPPLPLASSPVKGIGGAKAASKEKEKVKENEVITEKDKEKKSASFFLTERDEMAGTGRGDNTGTGDGEVMRAPFADNSPCHSLPNCTCANPISRSLSLSGARHRGPPLLLRPPFR